MPVRLLTGLFIRLDAFAVDDFESVAIGAIEIIPQVTGNGDCILFEGTFFPRILT